MRKLILKASVLLALPVLILALAGFQRAVRFSESVRALTTFFYVDTLQSPNGDVYVKDNLDVKDTVKIGFDSVTIFQRPAYGVFSSKRGMTLVIDADNNETTSIFSVNTNGPTGTTLFQATEVNSGNASFFGNLTVTDTTTATGGLKVGTGTLITGIVDKTDSLLIILNVTDSCYVKITTRL